MNDRTPTGPSGHLSAIERARLARYDKILVRLCYMGVTLLYASGALSSLALLKKIVEDNGPMAAVYLGVAMALFGAGEKARRGAVRLRRTGGAAAPV
ncbi:hypothetical protein GCM10010215_15330 [Streptomyces virginiae]|uniref:hypothetical protein n=1 Tax=Streptomyces TaxID=1883 RepID=UPI000A4F4B3E|nr:MULTISPECIES: hypothetical protein [Streptomyces]MBP2343941.1 hypothetical protein [Streptomyces virginiae]GGP90304.1 hypothetical protein GCM10010215_15330 [Streptomyces virginiae]